MGVRDGKWTPARNKSLSKRRRRGKIRSSRGEEPRRSKWYVEVDKQDETRTPASMDERKKSSFVFQIAGGPNLHLGKLERVLPAGPGGPLDAVGVGGVLAAQVLAVQVGRVAVAVPPGAVVEGGAVVLRVVVVPVFGGELHPVVLQQGVT